MMRAARLVATTVVLSIVAGTATPAGPGQGRPTDADPVDLGTGLYVREITDIAIGGDPPILLARVYRNADDQSRAFGVGTNHAYELYLTGDGKEYRWATLGLKDGGRIDYVRTSPGTQARDAEFVHTATPTEFFMSRLRPAPPRGWRIDLQDGGYYLFDGYSGPVPHVRLIEHQDSRGRRVTLRRNADGDLTRINGGWFRRIYLKYDAGHRIIRAKTGWGPSMATVDYAYDPRGRLVSVHAKYINVYTVAFELVQAYAQQRLPSLWRMRVERAAEYTYDEKNRMEAIAEEGLELMNHYDSASRVIRQDQAGLGSWTFTYKESRAGKVIQTDVIRPDGSHRRAEFNRDGYALSDVDSPGLPDERRTDYERGPGNIVTRITVTCGLQQTTEAIGSGETDEQVRQRLLSRCGRFGVHGPPDSSHDGLMDTGPASIWRIRSLRN